MTRWYRLSPLETAAWFLGGGLLATPGGGLASSLVVAFLFVVLGALLHYRDWQRRSVRLVDAEKMHEKFPETFDLPAGRYGLSYGDLAMLSFGGLERMWVQVVRVNLPARAGTISDLSYVGVLMNEPVVACLKYGTEVAFEPRHVYGLGGNLDARRTNG